MNHPFAVEMFERFLKGESIRELAEEFQIPADRVELRLRAAALYLEHQAQSGRIELPSRYRDHYCLHATGIITVIPSKRTG